MTTFYLTLLLIGAVVLVVQLVLGVIGADSELDADGADGLDLFTVRALSTAAAAFGATGLGLMQWGLAGWLAFPVAGAVGLGAAVAIAATMRSMRRLEQDKSFDIAMTLGASARVALSVPGARAGEGKVHLNAHGRFMELNAVTTEDTIPAGEEVHVVDTIAYDTVLVSRRPTILEESHGPR